MAHPISGKLTGFRVEFRVELCTFTTIFKYCQRRIGSSYLNDMFMPSQNNYSTKSHMALDMPLCRTNKGSQKYVISWTKDPE